MGVPCGGLRMGLAFGGPHSEIMHFPSADLPRSFREFLCEFHGRFWAHLLLPRGGPGWGSRELPRNLPRNLPQPSAGRRLRQGLRSSFRRAYSKPKKTHFFTQPLFQFSVNCSGTRKSNRKTTEKQLENNRKTTGKQQKITEKQKKSTGTAEIQLI